VRVTVQTYDTEKPAVPVGADPAGLGGFGGF
jgi:hypothetical protein